MITKIEVEKNGECTFYMDGSEEPFSIREFIRASPTRICLTLLENLIDDINRTLEELGV